MEGGYRQRLVKFFTFLGGVYFVFEFLMPQAILKSWGIAERHEAISLGFVAIGLVAFGLGIINLFMIHGSKIVFRRKGWLNSIALLTGLLMMVTFSAYDWRLDLRHEINSRDAVVVAEFARDIVMVNADAERRASVPPLPVRLQFLAESAEKLRATTAEAFTNEAVAAQTRANRDVAVAVTNISESLNVLQESVQRLNAADNDEARLAAAQAISANASSLAFLKKQYGRAVTADSYGKRVYSFLFNALFVSLGSAMFSLLGVYIAAAAYRAFRIRTVESSLMMLAALIVMLGQIPFGRWLYSELPEIRAWLLEVPNAAATRAIGFGALVASLVLAFRMWFSIESDKFSGDK
ncbi:MAG: hypothetical protein J5J00_07265 [Deltaproteobacteria bacterium]|nr:hypothetical protein [Deltaproteobacteria bacterium]